MVKNKDLSTTNKTTSSNRRNKCDSSTLLPVVAADYTNMADPSGEIILYQPDDNIRLEVRLNEETVWLNRQQLAQLFDRDVKTIGKHINNALREELKGMATVAKFAIVQENTVYHIGASLKDLGKKWFAFSKMEIKTKELLSNMK